MALRHVESLYATRQVAVYRGPSASMATSRSKFTEALHALAAQAGRHRDPRPHIGWIDRDSIVPEGVFEAESTPVFAGFGISTFASGQWREAAMVFFLEGEFKQLSPAWLNSARVDLIAKLPSTAATRE